MDGFMAAQRLKRLRYANGMSRQKLAQASGVSLTTIGRLETDPTYWDVVTDRTLLPIARALDVPADYFTSKEDDVPEQFQPSGYKASGIKQEDLGTLLAALKPKIQVHKPIREDMDDLPRRAHREEPWEDKMLCLLEHVRQAIMDWSDDEEIQDYESLLGSITAEVEEWARRHGVPVPDDIQFDEFDSDIQGGDDDHLPENRKHAAKQNAAIIDASKMLYSESRGSIERILEGPIRRMGTAGELLQSGNKVKTTRARVGYDGEHYDEIEVGGKRYFIRCPHDTDSKEPKDHPFVLALGKVRSSAGEGANG